MRYWVRAVLGFVLLAAGLVAFLYALYEMMSIGTCSSGSPYVSERECPDGTFAKALLIPGGFMTAGVGALVFGFRGPKPGARPGAPQLSGLLVLWCGVFIGGGVVALVADLRADEPGADWVGIFLAALFVPMGLVPLLVLWFGRPSPRRNRSNSRTAAGR